MDCKLYIITHSDLPLKYQVPQSNHAAMEFAAQYPTEFLEWHKKSNSIIVLNCQNERKLIEFAQKLRDKGIKFSEFREPDIGNELTAIAICPGPEIKRLCSGLPLAGKRTNEGAEDRLNRKFEIMDAMKTCEQRSGQNIWEHGESVRDHLMDLLKFLRDSRYTSKYTWRYPQWLLSHSRELLGCLPPDHVLEKYALWHDCGKPFCKVQDENGKVHYPDHAKVSASIFRELYPEQEDVATLIEMDMDIHLLPADGIEEFCTRPQAIALLLTAVAEVHANAELFGGITTDSFKIKWKHLGRRGASICKRLFE
jgi:peptidyl-tRNA hydrolase